MKNTLWSLTSIGLLTASANAAVSLSGLTATATDDPMNGEAFGGGGLAVLTNDPFSYNIDDPASVLPSEFVGSIFHGFASDNTDIIIDFTVTSTTFASGDILFVDLYGRSGSNATRDNLITVEFFNGATSIGEDSMAGITTGTHSRASFTATSAGNITGFRVTGADSAQGGGNFFALTEVRAGLEAIAVPEPSSTALLALGGIALILRRSKRTAAF